MTNNVEFARMVSPAEGEAMRIPVVKMHGRTGDDSDFVEIALHDVNYIDLWRPTGSSVKVLSYYTSFGSFVGLSTLKDAAKAFAPYGFSQYDASYLINERKIMNVKDHHDGSSIYFKDGSHVIVRRRLV